MIAQYDKVIVIKVNDVKKVVIIFDETLHLPIFYDLDKYGMDDLLELFNSDNGVIPK